MEGLRRAVVKLKAYASIAKPASSSTRPVPQEAKSSGPAPAAGEYDDSVTMPKLDTGLEAVQVGPASCPVGQLRPRPGRPAGLASIIEEGDPLDRQIIPGTSTGAGDESLLHVPPLSTEASLQDAFKRSAPDQVTFCISFKCLCSELSGTRSMQTQSKPLGRGLLQKQKILAEKEQTTEGRDKRRKRQQQMASVQTKQLEVSPSSLTHMPTLTAILAYTR